MVELIAHRAGNRAEYMDSVRDVVDHLEIDAHFASGRMQVRHAKRVWLTKRYWERWYLLPKGEAAFPSLAEIIEAAGPDIGLWVDCKGTSRSLPKAVMAVAGVRRPLTVSTKSWWLMRGFASHTGVRKIRSAGNKFEVMMLRRLPTRVALDGVVLHQRLLNKELVAELKDRFGLLFSWAIEDFETGTRLADWGVDGLIVDDHDLLRTLAATLRKPRSDLQ